MLLYILLFLISVYIMHTCTVVSNFLFMPAFFVFRSQTKGPSAEGEDFVPEADGIIEVNIYDHTCLFPGWISLSLYN